MQRQLTAGPAGTMYYNILANDGGERINMYIEDSVPLPPIFAGPVFLIPPPHTQTSSGKKIGGLADTVHI